MAAPSYGGPSSGNFGETIGEVGKSGVLKHKSGNNTETRKDRGKITMEGLWKLTKALERYQSRPLRPRFRYWGFTTLAPNSNRYYLRNG